MAKLLGEKHEKKKRATSNEQKGANRREGFRHYNAVIVQL
jgi:hypothetical protein